MNGEEINLCGEGINRLWRAFSLAGLVGINQSAETLSSVAVRYALKILDGHDFHELDSAMIFE
jgi:hypothetical protein